MSGVGGAPQPEELEPEHTEGFKVRERNRSACDTDAYGAVGRREEDDR